MAKPCCTVNMYEAFVTNVQSHRSHQTNFFCFVFRHVQRSSVPVLPSSGLLSPVLLGAGAKPGGACQY